jgi:hypothetical protein
VLALHTVDPDPDPNIEDDMLNLLGGRSLVEEHWDNPEDDYVNGGL